MQVSFKLSSLKLKWIIEFWILLMNPLKEYNRSWINTKYINYSESRLILLLLMWSATKCDHISNVPYIIDYLVLSLLIWPKVITLSDFKCNFNFYIDIFALKLKFKGTYLLLGRAKITLTIERNIKFWNFIVKTKV